MSGHGFTTVTAIRTIIPQTAFVVPCNTITLTDFEGSGGHIAIPHQHGRPNDSGDIPRMNESTKVCVVRHGETDWNIAGILQGWIDVPINEKGRGQAHELSEAFAASGFTCIYTSPLSRALETAQIIARDLGLAPPVCHEGLKERHFGSVQGVPKAELAELNPVLLQQILQRNPACSFDQGESMDEFATRVLDALMNIGERNAGGRVLLITHGWVMDVITRHINGLPRSAILNMKRKNGESVWLDVLRQSIRPLHIE